MPQVAGSTGPGADVDSSLYYGAQGSDIGPPADILDDVSGPSADALPDISAAKPGTFTNTAAALGNGIMRGYASLGRMATVLLGMPAAAGIDALTGGTGAQDAVGAFVDHVLNNAVQYWQPTGPTGKGAQILGDVASMIPGLAAPGAEFTLPAQSAVDAGVQSIQAGQDAKTAVTLALTAAATTAAGMKLPMKSPVLIKRLASGALGNVALTAGASALTKKILQDRGYQQAAQQVNPFAPESLIESGLVGAIFGAIAGSGKRPASPEKPATSAANPESAPTGAMAESAGPPADLVLPDEQGPITSPAPPALAVAHLNGTDVPVQVIGDAGGGQTRVRVLDETGAAGQEQVIPTQALGSAAAISSASSPVADVPSAEPVSDLQAQVADMRDPATPRQAVYLSSANVGALGPRLAALADGLKRIPNFDRKGGMLLVPDTDAARVARALRAAQPDMQVVLGQLTGAGEGKPAGESVVVQGRTPDGAVASETAVAPEDVLPAVEAATDQGKTPVITTPEDAIRRRVQLLAAEKELPPMPETGPLRPAAEARPETRSAALKQRAAAMRAQKPAATNELATRHVERETIDDMADQRIDPRNVAVEFWRSTYPGLDESGRARAEAMLKHEGFEPGSRLYENFDGTVTRATDWQEAGLFHGEGLPTKSEHLEGTARGLVAFMKRANDQADAEPAKLSAPQADELNTGSYADRLFGSTAAAIDRAGFQQHVQALTDAGRPESLHAILDFAGRHADNDAARAIIQSIRTRVLDTPVRFMAKLEAPSGQELHPSTAGFHSMALGRHEIQVLANHPFAHPLRTVLHEAVHAATVGHMRMEPDSKFSREIERLRQIAVQRAQRQLGRPLVEADYKDSALYGLKNAKEFAAEALSNSRFQQFLLSSEHYATRGELLHSLVWYIGDAVRRLFGLREGPQADLLHNVLFATDRLMAAQHGMNDRLARLFGQNEAELPATHDALSTSQQLQQVYDALEVHGPERAFRGEDRLMWDVPAALRDPLRRAKYWSGARLDNLRKTSRALATYDQLVRRALRHFGSPDDPANPLRRYDDEHLRRITVQNRALDKTVQAAQRWSALSATDQYSLGAMMRDSTLWGIDPRKALTEQTATVQGSTRAVRKHGELVQRWNALTSEQRAVYTQAEADNRRMARLARRTVVDTVLRSVGAEPTPAQRSLLYAVTDPRQFEALIGEGKPIDLSEFNDSARDTLTQLSPLTEMEGPYFHLGREGSKVVSVNPEGEKTFTSKAEAEGFIRQVRELGPESTAVLSRDGDNWHVEYHAKYVSMHKSAAEAEADAARLRGLGFDVGPVTEKQIGTGGAPVTSGMRQLLAEAQRRIDRLGAGDEAAATNKALIATLHSAFSEMLAARYEHAAGSIQRRGVAGVKPDEMLTAFKRHAISSASHIGTMATLFDEAAALARLREAARNPEVGNASQQTMYARGLFMHELDRRIQQDAQGRAAGGAVNSALSKLGFLTYISSPSHALVWLTQNFTTGIPVAGARFGYWKAVNAFGRGMKHAVRIATAASHSGVFKGSNVEPQDIIDAILKAAQRDPAVARWASGANSPLQQLAERGALTSSLANVLSSLANTPGGPVRRAGWNVARYLPHLADTYNRVSTAIAGLELTGGDVSKTADLIHAVHMKYGTQNAPRAFKAAKRLPGGASATMLATYRQGMVHLLYSNVADLLGAGGKSRWEAAKTVAGLVAANAAFAGLVGATPELVRWPVTVWHDIFGDKDKYFDFNTALREELSDLFGHVGGEWAAEGLPRAIGMDLSQRMGLSSLLLWNPPDLLAPGDTTDKLKDLVYSLGGPGLEMIGNAISSGVSIFRQGFSTQAIEKLLPLKAAVDVAKAGQLATRGYKTPGVSVPANKIGPWQVGMQALGLRPEAVANAAERAGTAYDYRSWSFARKAEILKAYTANPTDPSVQKQIAQWDRENPGMLITRSDLIKAARGQYRAAQLGAGLPGRDPTVNRLLSY
jgi:hypothetical protein